MIFCARKTESSAANSPPACPSPKPTGWFSSNLACPSRLGLRRSFPSPNPKLFWAGTAARSKRNGPTTTLRQSPDDLANRRVNTVTISIVGHEDKIWPDVGAARHEEQGQFSIF